jgi:hypothetical protein
LVRGSPACHGNAKVENAQVATALLEVRAERWLKTSRSTLLVLAGAKALTAGVKRVFGRQAIIQQCQIHQRRNVWRICPIGTTPNETNGCGTPMPSSSTRKPACSACTPSAV